MNANEGTSSVLTDRQGKFLGFVLCFAGALLLGGLITALVYVLNLAFDLFSGVIWSLAVSGMLAILLRPIVTFFEERIRLGRIASILLLYLLVVASCGSAIFLLGGKVISQTREFVGTAADWPQQIHDKVKNSEYVSPESLDAISTQVDAFKKYWKELIGTGGKTLDLSLSPEEKTIYDSLEPEERKTFREVWKNLDPDDRQVFLSLEEKKAKSTILLANPRKCATGHGIDRQAGEEIAQKSAEVIKSAWSGLMGFFANLTYLAVIPIYLFYFLSSNRNLIDDLEGELGFLSPSVKEDVVFLIREFVGIMVAFFRGQLMIGLLMGIGYAIGFTLSGLKFGIALGLLFGLLNIVPYLGYIVGIGNALLVAYLQHGGISEPGEWTVAWLRCFLCGRPVDRELLLDA